MSFRAFAEAVPFVAPLVVMGAVAFALGAAWAGWLLLILALAVALFFRDPDRKVPRDPAAIVAPADGLVDVVEEVLNAPGVGGPGMRISIFLSVLDVHINRFPVPGVVREVVHTPGEFLDARLPECAFRNERQLWVLECSAGRVGVRQIAGLIARRIVAWGRVGDQVSKGDRMGLIRFGSRTDLYLPLAVTVCVKPGDRVTGGKSVMARWHNPPQEI